VVVCRYLWLAAWQSHWRHQMDTLAMRHENRGENQCDASELLACMLCLFCVLNLFFTVWNDWQHGNSDETIGNTSTLKKILLVQIPILLWTRSSAIAEGPRDASCQLKSCQLPRNSAETTYTTFLTKSMVWSWRFSRRQCVIDNVHSTMMPSSRLPLSGLS